MPTREALAAAARDFHARGWMAGTAGNLSAREPGDRRAFWITASGRPKGRLEPEDLVRVRVEDGAVVERLDPEARPSAETAIHRAVYAALPQVGACFHVHTVEACLASWSAPGPELPLPPLEMLKGLGVMEERPEVGLPLFENRADVEVLAGEVAERLRRAPPRVPALLVRRHGLTVWGAGPQEAYDRVELLAFILDYLARGGR